MSEIRFTEEQKNVIAFRGGNLLVSAAAGSGKTAVLVERIISLVTDETAPSSLDRLLVMTFTRAAAEGMRQKIKAALAEKCAETAAALEDAQKRGEEAAVKRYTDLRNHLKTQESLLVRAHISTIDSYCQSLIRQYFQYLEIDPAFRAADEGELRLLKADVIRDLLEDRYEEGNETFLSFSGKVSKNGFDEKISALIEKTYSHAVSRPWPGRLLRSMREELSKEAESSFTSASWYKTLVKEIRQETEKHLCRLQKEAEKNSAADGWVPYREALSGLIGNCERILSAGTEYEALKTAGEAYTSPRLSTKKCPEGDPLKKESARAAIEEVRTWIKERFLPCFSLPRELTEKAESGAARDLCVLLDLTLSFMERFSEKKKSRGIVDFSDMEHLALALLYEEKDGEMKETALADSLSANFDEILIDEYQDSNEVQEALIRALSAERFGRPDVFMVGDVKQSIYGFRKARPELFMEKYRTYSPLGTPDKSNIKIELNRNFRSKKQVISSINDLFYDIMQPEVGGIRYDSTCALYAGRKDPEEDSPVENARTELLLMEENGEEVPGLTEEELSFLMIARRIKELTEEEGARYKKGDITILLRNGKHAEELVDLLSRAGIESVFDSSRGYFSATEVVTVLSFLSCIDNPRNDIPLCGVLRSYIGGFTDEELAGMRIRRGTEPSFYDVLRNEAAENDKAAGFLSLLNRYRALSAELSVHELISRIYEETGYYNYVSAMPGGRKRRKNLDVLLLRAENYCATSYHGLFNFIRYIEQLRKYDTDYGEAPSACESDDTVKISTIHKSKGLEYPVVIVAGMEREFNMTDTRESIVFDDTFGIACDYIDPETRLRYPSLKSSVIREQMKKNMAGEELRVLYVAMTRARDRLILSGKMKDAAAKIDELKGQPATPEKILSARSELSLVLLGDLPGKGNTVLRIYDKGTLSGLETEKTAGKILNMTELVKNSPCDEKIVEAVTRSVSAVYAHEEETRLKPKVSVSELKEEVIREQEFEFVRDLEEQKQVKGAEFGTLVHRAFEVLDYNAPAELCLPDLPGADPGMMEPVRRIIRTFRESGLGKQMEEAFREGRLYREQHFMIGVPAGKLSSGSTSEELQILQGIIDAYMVGPDGITLIDYKTDRVEDTETLKRRYSLQLHLYADALSQLLRLPVKKMILYSTRLSEVIEVS